MNTYYASIGKVLTELEPRFSAKEQEIICALGNICYSETPNEESFFRVAKFYTIDDEILDILQNRRRDSGSWEENVRGFRLVRG